MKRSIKQDNSNLFSHFEYTIYEKPQCFPALSETRICEDAGTTNDLKRANTNRRDVERREDSQRSTVEIDSKKKGASKTPLEAPWRGVDYASAVLPAIESYEDLAAVSDPILSAMAVTGDADGYPYWIKLLNNASGRLGFDLAMRLFRSSLELIFGQKKAGELRNPAAALNVMLQDCLR